MELLADWGWHFPQWLAWPPTIQVEGGPGADLTPSAGIFPAAGTGK